MEYAEYFPFGVPNTRCYHSPVFYNEYWIKIRWTLCKVVQCKIDISQYPITLLLWRHNERDSVSNHQHLYCLLKRLFRRRSNVTSKLRVTGLCAWNSPGTGEFPAQKASNAENVSIWWRHHATEMSQYIVHRSIYTINIFKTTEIKFIPLRESYTYLLWLKYTISCKGV